MTSRYLLLVLTVVVMVGCATPKPTRVASLVVVDGTVATPKAEVAACVDPAPIQKAVAGDGGFRWNVHRFTSAAAPSSEIEATVATMRANYLAPNFPACHAANLRADLAPARLLGIGKPIEAVRVALYGSACAWKLGPEFEPFAAAQLRFILAKDELDAIGELERSDILDPAFRDFVQALHAKVPPKRVWTSVSVTPKGASVAINGSIKCENSPCRFRATEGDTVVITAERFGYARYVGTLEAGRVGDFAMFSVDRETERQIAAAVQQREKSPYSACASSRVAVATPPGIGGTAPSLDAIGEAASRSLATKVVLLVDVRAKDASAMVYDQPLKRVVARRTRVASASQNGADLAPSVSLEALRAWRDKTTPRWYKSWKFWAGVAVVGALASGGAVYYFKENEYVVRPSF
ncbi:MAG: hypothetical protein ACKV2T_02545 [Kofleriaceae bacterium]